jgi:hypothetical protein
MKLRIIPQLHFTYDESIERGSHLSQLIDQAVASDAKLMQKSNKSWSGLWRPLDWRSSIRQTARIKLQHRVAKSAPIMYQAEKAGTYRHT